MVDKAEPVFSPSRQPFDWLKIIGTHQVLDTGAVKHRLTFEAEVKALQDVRFYQRRCGWTGQGLEQKPRVHSDTSGLKQRIHGPVLRDGEELLFLVDLGRQLAVGETVWVRTSQLLLDYKATARPDFRHAVRAPLTYLELRVSLPEELSSSVRFEVRDIRTNEQVGAPKPLERGAEGQFVVMVDQPRIGFEYKVVWLS